VAAITPDPAILSGGPACFDVRYHLTTLSVLDYADSTSGSVSTTRELRVTLAASALARILSVNRPVNTTGAVIVTLHRYGDAAWHGGTP
jgi:hypothetical protein